MQVTSVLPESNELASAATAENTGCIPRTVMTFIPDEEWRKHIHLFTITMTTRLH